jgi:hypothetical protein
MSFDCYELHPLNVGYFVMLPYVTVRGRHVVGKVMVTFVRRTLVSKVSNWSHQKCDFEAQDLDALYFEIIILPRVSQDAKTRMREVRVADVPSQTCSVQRAVQL